MSTSLPQTGASYTPQIAEPKRRRDNTHWLYIAVIVAVIGGVVVGLMAPSFAVQLKPLGDSFVSLIKMIITPVIFCTIVLGIGSVRSAATVGKTGGLALIYFIVMSTFALAIGLIVGNVIKPGEGINYESTAGEGAKYAQQAAESSHGLTGFIQGIIPTSFFSAFTSGTILQVLFIGLLVGFAVQSLGKQGEPILGFVAHLQKLIFKILSWILWLAPIGAFGAIAAVVGKTGIKAVVQMIVLMGAFYLTCFIFVFGILGLVLWVVTRVSPWSLFKYLGGEFLLILATSSSESALPNLMRKMEHLGVDKSTVGIVVPTGYSFNLDGTAIYLTMSSIFIADAMNMPMNMSEQISLLVFMIIASKGAAGVTGAGLATLAAGLQAFRPDLLTGVGVIVGIDRFMSEARALTNFAGNSIATLVVGTWTRTVDRDQVKRVLSGEDPYVPSDIDTHVNLSNPTVNNPATDHLQPTPQVDLSAYQQAAPPASGSGPAVR
ncbi:cation:dicarboxylate symporter family transporter [Corynebacterium sp. UBA2622]|uniref:cation:dicarboxylate symporter family transporter n=1 Tax=Corynebacterium sp. UBA2622 TaxID=1946393 RepID=UPI0025C2FB0A|nr:cation:dicarboxylase symporter family transporter [Corynebacterium sp. UBA2622]